MGRKIGNIPKIIVVLAFIWTAPAIIWLALGALIFSGPKDASELLSEWWG